MVEDQHDGGPGAQPPPADEQRGRPGPDPSASGVRPAAVPDAGTASDSAPIAMMPHGSFAPPGTVDPGTTVYSPFADPASRTPVPPPAPPLIEPSAVPTTPGPSPLPSSSPFGDPLAAGATAPAPLPTSAPAPAAVSAGAGPGSPWRPPDAGIGPFAGPGVAGPGVAGPGGAGPTPAAMGPIASPAPFSVPGPAPSGFAPAGAAGSGFAPSGPPPLAGLPAAPPQYDPRQYGGGFGAAGGAPAASMAAWSAPAPYGGASHSALTPGTSGSAPPPAAAGRPSARAAVVIGIVSAVIASLITGGLFVAFGRSSTAASSSPTTSVPSGPPGTYLANPLDIHGLLDAAQPSVVSIRTDTTSSAGSEPLGAGSGVIITDSGLVLTNAHVIAGASSMKVILFDGTTKTATLVGSFPDDDVALVQIEDPGTVTPARLGTSATLKVGDPVIAIGNALNLGGSPSVTEGIVSAKDRDIQTREGTLTNLIQTDAAINPGNSGGPLLDASGSVVGINTAIINNAQNIGFAISIDVIKPRIEDLKQGKGTVTQDTAFLGVSTQSLSDVTDAVLQRYGVTATDGAFVSEVVPGSAADAGGLQPGDVITTIDGSPIASAADVGGVIRNKKAGDSVTIEFERQGQKQTATVTLKSRAGG